MSSTNYPKGYKIKFGITENLLYLCNRRQRCCHSKSLYAMQNTSKQAAINALFNDVQFLSFYEAHMDAFRGSSDWDVLSCDEQMRLEDLVNTDEV